MEVSKTVHLFENGTNRRAKRVRSEVAYLLQILVIYLLNGIYSSCGRQRGPGWSEHLV